MQAAIPSRTALRVALRRAAHQLYDAPLVFRDPIAVPILGQTYAEELKRTPTREDRPFSTALRAVVVARSRYAEDGLSEAFAKGVRQYILLGAGLDTFAYRNCYPGLRVFEVDHPATQEWKRELIAQNGIAVPDSVAYAPVDFESQSLEEELARGGFDNRQPSFFASLGVVHYLTPEGFRATLRFVAAQPQGSGLVLDYGQPRSVLPPVEQQMYDSLAGRVQNAGEPFQLSFTPPAMGSELHRFRNVEDLGAEEINGRYFRNRSDQLRIRSSAVRLLCAWL